MNSHLAITLLLFSGTAVAQSSSSMADTENIADTGASNSGNSTVKNSDSVPVPDDLLPHWYLLSDASPTLLDGIPLYLHEGDTVSESAIAHDPRFTDFPDREEWLRNPIPHPYVYLGPSLMGGGYAVLAYRAQVGIDLESRHLQFRVSGVYDNGHKKVDDGDQPNPHGHDPYLG